MPPVVLIVVLAVTISFAATPPSEPLEITVTPAVGPDSIRALLAGGLAERGGTLFFAPGTYELDRALAPPSGVTLRGLASSDSLATLRVTAPGFRSAIEIAGVSGVGVEGLVLDGSMTVGNEANRYGVRVRGPARDLTIRRCRFRGFSHAVHVGRGEGEVDGVHVVENEMLTQTADPDFVNYGIFVHEDAQARDVRIERNDISGRNPGGGGGSAISFGGSRSVISENFIHDYRTMDLGGIGILIVEGAKDNRVVRNSFRTVWGDNVSVRGTGTWVAGNAIADSKDQGIVVEDASRAQIIANATTETKTPGVRVLNSRGVVIRRNDISEAATAPAINDITRAGLCLANSDDPDERIDDVRLQRNRIHVSAAALFGIALGGDDVIRGVTLGGNVIENATTAIGGRGFPVALAGP